MEIRAFWWRGKDGMVNLGDEITPYVLEELFGTEARLSPFDSAELLSTGSILGWVWARPTLANRSPDRPLHIVGSGLMDTRYEISSYPFLTAHSVRGEISRAVLTDADIQVPRVGDPAVIAPEAGFDRQRTRYAVGLIPHYGHVENASLLNRFQDIDGLRVIDYRTSDVRGTLSDMSACELIVSQSLHGVILADALGIPCTWLRHGRLHSGADLKFLDYFSTVNRPFSHHVSGTGPVTLDMLRAQAFSPDRTVIRQLQREVHTAFRTCLGQLN